MEKNSVNVEILRHSIKEALNYSKIALNAPEEIDLEEQHYKNCSKDMKIKHASYIFNNPHLFTDACRAWAVSILLHFD